MQSVPWLVPGAMLGGYRAEFACSRHLWSRANARSRVRIALRPLRTPGRMHGPVLSLLQRNALQEPLATRSGLAGGRAETHRAVLSHCPVFGYKQKLTKVARRRDNSGYLSFSISGCRLGRYLNLFSLSCPAWAPPRQNVPSPHRPRPNSGTTVSHSPGIAGRALGGQVGVRISRKSGTEDRVERWGVPAPPQRSPRGPEPRAACTGPSTPRDGSWAGL